MEQRGLHLEGSLSEKMAYLIFPEIGISMTKELKQSMKEVTDPLRQRLKANGF